MFGKKYTNLAELDLRNYSSEALKKIRKIENVGGLILPKNAGNEWTEAFSKIKVKNCGSMIYLESGEILHKINGAVLLDDKSVNDGEKYFVGGAAVIATKEKRPLLFLNGAAVVLGDANYSVEDLNGALVKADPKGEYRIYPNSIKVDFSMLENLPEDFSVVAGNCIEIDDDVMETALKEKRISFFAGNRVRCSKAVCGYVKANSQVGNTVAVK